MHDLLVRLSGGEDVVNEVIEMEIPLAEKLSWKYRSQKKYPRDAEVLSIAYMAVVKGVNDLKGHIKPEHIEPTLNRRITNAILTFLSLDKLIPVPRASKFDAGQRGDPIVEKSIYNINVCGDEADYEIADNTYTEMRDGKELQEYFDCVLNDLEKQIIQSVMRGLSNVAIAKGRGVSKQYIGEILRGIRQKCYAISICSGREDTLQGCGVLLPREESSQTLISDEYVRRTYATRVLEPVGNDSC